MTGDARSNILGRMRQALGRGGPDDNSKTAEAARQEIAVRLAKSEPPLVPARGDLDLEARLALFTQQARAVQADVIRVRDFADIPDQLSDYLRQHNLPKSLVMAADQDLAALSWDHRLWDIRQGKPNDDNAVGLTTAVAGIAETGTLMLASDADHPTTLAILPETSIVTVRSSLVHRAYEDALRLFRETQDLPRSINFITGPSRSGDIEQTLQLGAHGPRRLLIILVDDDRAEHQATDASPLK